MSDFAQSVLINGLLNNSIDRLSLQNNVVPGALDFNQYSGLTACRVEKDGASSVMLCQPVTTGSSSSSSTKTAAVIAAKKCDICKHDHETANNLMLKKLDFLCEVVKHSERPTHFMRDSMLVSTNLEDILTNKTVWIWVPHKIPGSLPLHLLTCWNEKCRHKGKISCIRHLHKSVEAFDEKGFLIYVEYRCLQCHKDKSSLEAEALEQMGVPLNVIKKIPVLNLNCSAWSVDYFSLCCLATTKEMGVSSFASMTAKARTSRWAEDAYTYLQVHILLVTPVVNVF